MHAKSGSRRFTALVVPVLGGAAAALLWSSSGAAVLPAGNLVKNPGADDGTAGNGSTVTPPASWQTTGSFTAIKYGSPGFPTKADGPPDAGTNFFGGGPTGAQSTAAQSIDVSAAAAEIDAGGVRATLSAWLGGYQDQSDFAEVEAVFLGAGGGELGTLNLIGPGVGDRGAQTKLLRRSTDGSVPQGTRAIRVTLTAKRLEGDSNDGYVDSVELTLAGATARPIPKPGATTRASGPIARDARTATASVTSSTGNLKGTTLVADADAERRTAVGEAVAACWLIGGDALTADSNTYKSGLEDARQATERLLDDANSGDSTRRLIFCIAFVKALGARLAKASHAAASGCRATRIEIIVRRNRRGRVTSAGARQRAPGRGDVRYSCSREGAASVAIKANGRRRGGLRRSLGKKLDIVAYRHKGAARANGQLSFGFGR